MIKSFCFFVIGLQILWWVSSVTCRPLSSNHGFSVNQQGLAPNTQISQETLHIKEGIEGFNEERSEKWVSKIGSIPPSCERKCCGCIPCEAIQVPTVNSHGNLNLQYTNYEPEGWKCKCGLSVYSP